MADHHRLRDQGIRAGGIGTRRHRPWQDHHGGPVGGARPGSPGHGNWLLWYYFLMFAAGLGQLGGIVGGVGQAMAISMPLTQQGKEFNEYLRIKTDLAVAEKELLQAGKNSTASADLPAKQARVVRDRTQ